MKKFLSLFLTAVIAVNALAGCSFIVKSSSDGESQAEESSAAENTDDDEVNYLHTENPESEAQEETPEPSNSPLSDEETQQAVETIESVLSSNSYSGTVLVSVGNTIIFEESYGYADSDETEENTNDTYYQIGSVTKQFTGAAILKLEREGKLSTSDTLDKYFDSKDYDYMDDASEDYLEGITVAQLLEMTAGFGDYMTIIEGDEEKTKEYVKAADKSDEAAKEYIVDAIINEGIYTTPGATYIYSNSSYYLLGIIIEQITGEEYRDYIQENFLDAAGMTDTYFVGDGMDSQTGYSYSSYTYVSDIDSEELAAEGGYAYLFSAGSIVSTAEDINDWLDAIVACDVITESDCDKIEGAEYYYNYGWNTSDNCWHHSGRTYAYSSQIYLDRENDVKVVLLTNVQFFSNLSTIAWQIYQPVDQLVAAAR